MSDKETPKYKSGVVSIVGRPNVGKSTLLNTILGEKIAIVSKVPQTTRNQIRGIYSSERGQIVFIDTPGIHKGKDKLDRFMNDSSAMTFDDVDCLIYVVDLSRRIGAEEKMIAERLVNLKAPIVLAMNKVDLGKDNIPGYIEHWEKVSGKSITELENFTLIPISGLKEKNIDDLLDVVYGYLPEGPALYPEDTITDMPQRLAISEIIREKLFQLMKDEVPHSIGVVIERIQPRKGKTLAINALIVVERDTHKEIVIGKKGEILKTVGTRAREELESLLESKVFLDLHVKTAKNWRDDISILQEIGYTQE